MDSAWVVIRAQNALEHKVVSYKLDFSPAFRAVLRYAKLLYAGVKRSRANTARGLFAMI